MLEMVAVMVVNVVMVVIIVVIRVSCIRLGVCWIRVERVFDSLLRKRFG